MCTWASLCIPMYVFWRTGNKFSGITYLLLNQLLTYTAKETNTYTCESENAAHFRGFIKSDQHGLHLNFQQTPNIGHDKL